MIWHIGGKKGTYMTRQEKEQRRKEVLQCICTIPKNMIKLHGVHNLTEFLLYHLADSNCFNFSKAAYFIENRDFNRLKGIAGYHGQENFSEATHWAHPEKFSQFTSVSNFNKQVRSVDLENIDLGGSLLSQKIARDLHFEKPSFCSWPIKYDNQGIFIFELHNEDEKELVNDHLEESLHLFGFCPVF